MVKVWTPEERKAFAEKMKERKLAKQNTTPTEPTVPEETPKPASEEANSDPIAAKIAEMDAAIKKTHELNAKLEAQAKEQSERFESGFKGMSVQEQATVIEGHKSKAQRQKEHFAKQDKVKIFVPLEGKEKLGQQLPVTVNGYRVNVPKGVYCEVPEQVAQIVMDSLNQTEAAVNNPKFVIDSDERKGIALG